MPNGIPTNQPVFRTLDYGALVRKMFGDAWHQKETAYQFQNGRKFDDSGPTGAFYRGTGT